MSVEHIEVELKDMELKLRNAREAAASPQASDKDKADLKLLEQEFQAAQGRAQRARDAGDKQPGKAKDTREKLDKKLDTALEQTFPGSDPVSVAEPSTVKKQDRPLAEVKVAEQQAEERDTERKSR